MDLIRKNARKLRRFIFRNPILPAQVSQKLLIQQAVDFFNLPQETVLARYQDYKRYHLEQQYEKKLGERKTLCFEEAFLLYLSVLRLKPKQVVEIGTQYGKSTRRILDILYHSGVHDCKMTCFDILDQVTFFSPEEAELILVDVTNNFKEQVLLGLNPKLIFLDAHPYRLLYNVILEFLIWSSTHPAILAIHDCSPRLYKSHMSIDKENAEKITSQTGVWERHVLSEVFQVTNKLLDDLHTSTHHLKIFNTPHGLALIMPKQENS